jgi:hypothetical protein
MLGGGGVKKCFIGLWQTALLSAEGKKEKNEIRLNVGKEKETIFNLLHNF